MDMSDVSIQGVQNGEIVFGNEPLLSIKGPLNKVQLIETTLLNLTNYPTLIATLARTIRRRVGDDVILVENGSESAQSLNGMLIGTKYSIVGGADCI